MQSRFAEFTLESATGTTNSMRNEADSISPELALRQGVGETTNRPGRSQAQSSATLMILIACMQSEGFGQS